MANNCLTNVNKFVCVCAFCAYISPTFICRISSPGSGASPVPNGWVGCDDDDYNDDEDDDYDDGGWWW